MNVFRSYALFRKWRHIEDASNADDDGPLCLSGQKCRWGFIVLKMRVLTWQKQAVVFYDQLIMRINHKTAECLLPFHLNKIVPWMKAFTCWINHSCHSVWPLLWIGSFPTPSPHVHLSRGTWGQLIGSCLHGRAWKATATRSITSASVCEAKRIWLSRITIEGKW